MHILGTKNALSNHRRKADIFPINCRLYLFKKRSIKVIQFTCMRFCMGLCVKPIKPPHTKRPAYYDPIFEEIILVLLWKSKQISPSEFRF